MWRNPMPWKNTPETPNIGTWAQTDDIRPGLGWQGLENLQQLRDERRRARGRRTTPPEFAIDVRPRQRRERATAPTRSTVVGSFLRTKVVDETSPIVYGMPDNLAVYSDDGESFSVSNIRAARRSRRPVRSAAAPTRATGRGTADDPRRRAGSPDARLRQHRAPPRGARWQPWQAAPITDDQLRNPLNIIPPDQRPRVPLRFADQRELLVSGLLDGGGDIAQRPVVVDVAAAEGARRAVREQPDLSRRDDRQLLRWCSTRS